MNTPSTSRPRKRTLEDSPANELENSIGYEYYNSQGLEEESADFATNGELHQQLFTAEGEEDEDEIYLNKSKRRRRGSPSAYFEEEEEKPNPNFSKDRDTPYLAYNEDIWNPMWLYRLPQDITLQSIQKSGGEGVGRREVGNDLLMDTSTKAGNRRVSSFIVNVCNDKKSHIGQYQKMDGKIRSIKYYWKADNKPEKFKNLFDKFEEVTGVKCPFQLGQVIKFPEANLNTLRISDVTLRRLNDLLELLANEKIVVTIHRVLKYIEEKEREAGYNFSIDKKSLLKCIKALEREGLLRLVETMVSCDGATNKVPILCHKEITSDDPLINESIQKAIDQYHQEGRVFPHGQLRYSVKKRGEFPSNDTVLELSAAEKILKDFDPSTPLTVEDRFNMFRAMTARATVIKKEETEALEEIGDHANDNTMDSTLLNDSIPPNESLLKDVSLLNDTSLLNDISIAPTPIQPQKRLVRMGISLANKYGYQSKFLRYGLIHEIAYHFVHGHSMDVKPTFYEKFPLGEAAVRWKFDPNPHVYVDSEGPLRFIPPLPPFAGLERGWFMLQDFVSALPLSVMILCVYTPKSIDNALTDEYLRHDIKRHTLIGDLPNELKIPLLRDKKLYRQVEHCFFTLSAMGLMCVGPNPDPKRFVTPSSVMFYVGRKGTVYDTSTSQRGYATIAEPLGQYDKYEYEFEYLDDLRLYWQHLRAVAQSTPLSYRTDMESEAYLQRHKKYSIGFVDKTPLTHNYDENLFELSPLEPHDGCAGFDSALFLHLRRHWDINPRPSSYVSWFITRFRGCAEKNQETIESRVLNLQRDWNSFVKSMMPSDLDLTRTKKAIASTNAVYPSTRASITIEPKSKSRLQSAKKPKEVKKKKRPLDSVDLVSQENRIHVRCRFIPREKDMLILIRAVGFFLNPVYRFWLDPKVLRDIMHKYVPESRTKTVQSLMAAGVREMVRPARLAYLQRIVRNLSTFPEMRQLRYKLATEPLFDPSKKTSFFKDAFDTANRLLFVDDQNMPHPSASDAVFEQFLTDGDVVISPEQTQSNPIPLRSRIPTSLAHIHHCVAVNVLLGIFMHGGDGILNEKILNQINATVVQDALQILRSDGLVSRTRMLDPHLMVMTKNHAILSYYFRHFFAHRFHPDIIEQTNHILRSFPIFTGNSEHFNYSGDHVGIIVAATNSFLSNNDMDVFVNPEILAVFEDAAVDNAQNSTKQIRYLENTDIHLEKIKVSHVLNALPHEVPNVEELVQILDKSLKNTADMSAPNIYIKSFKKESVRNPMQKVYNIIMKSGAFGVKLDDIVQQSKLKAIIVKEAISNLLEGGIILAVGVDDIRWISNEFKEAWCVTVNDKVIFPKPWTLPNGEICLSTVRWMAESCLFTIVANAGMPIKDLRFRYEFALQPAAVVELVHFLEKAGCVIIEEKKFPSMDLASPFDDTPSYITCTYVVPVADCMERFARIFSDVPLLATMVSTNKPDDEQSAEEETINEEPESPQDNLQDALRPLLEEDLDM